MESTQMRSLVLSSILLLAALAAQADPLPSNPKRHFSPNLDGVKDALVVPLSIKKDGFLTKWRVTISRKVGVSYEVVRSFESQSALEIRVMTPKKFLERIVQKKERIAVPPTVEWDGVLRIAQGSNLVESRGPDGIYWVRIFAQDESGNEQTSDYLPVALDTVRPELTATLAEPVFSPNGDGRKERDRLTLRADKAGPLDVVVADLFDASNRQVSRFQWKVGELTNGATTFDFDGRSDSGKDLPEGEYRFLPAVWDLAGNSNRLPALPFRLVRTFETLSLQPSLKSFSPGNDGFFDTVKIAARLSSGRGLLKWTLRVDSTNVPAGPSRTWTGSGNNPEITFDGKDDAGKQLPDGIYAVRGEAEFDSGNRPVAETRLFEIDTTAPEVAIRSEAPNFVPLSSNQSARKSLAFALATKGRDADRYALDVLDDQSNVIFTTDFSNRAPDSFAWNGLNRQGAVVPGKYRAVLRGEDPVGNRRLAESQAFDLIGEDARAIVSTSLRAFSPGRNQNRDTVTLTAEVNQKSLVREMKWTLRNSKGEAVRTLVTNVFQPQTPWDGRDDKGEVLADDRYVPELSVVLSTEERIELKARSVVLDTTPPAFEALRSPEVFSPNQDGALETIELSFRKVPSRLLDSQDAVVLEILGADRKIVARRTWTGELPGLFTWDGLDLAGKPAPEGDYEWRLTAVDAAGNTAVTAGPSFSLARTPSPLKVSLDETLLRPSRPRIEVSPSFEKPRFVDAYDVVLLDAQSNRLLVGRRKAGEKFVFEGIDLEKKKVEDGRYDLLVESVDRAGLFSSARTPVTIDRTAPVIRLATLPEVFSPDADGVDDVLTIGLKTEDAVTGVSATRLRIFRKVATGTNGKPFAQTLSNYLAQGQRPFHEWKLPSGPVDTRIEWDGRDASGATVEGANDYVLFAEADDAAGLTSVASAPVVVDVLVERLADGRLRMIVNSITFAFDSARLEGDWEKTIDRVVKALRRFPDYRVNVVGHTDSRGTLRRNQELSKQRAQSIHTQLILKDLARERLSYEGKGPNELLISPEKIEGDDFRTEENYRKNRRVEFFLKKEEKK